MSDKWICYICGTEFDEYINGCPHCENAGLRSGVRQPASPPAQPSGERQHARLLEQTRPIQPTAEFVIADFRKWYDSLPYKGADENEMFRDWMYIRLLELYKAHVLTQAEPSPRVERQSAAQFDTFREDERIYDLAIETGVFVNGVTDVSPTLKQLRKFAEAYAAHNSVSVSATTGNLIQCTNCTNREFMVDGGDPLGIRLCCSKCGEQKLIEQAVSAEAKPPQCRKVLIGGNHLASMLINSGCDPGQFQSFNEVQEKFGIGIADVWICWKAIMEFRCDLDQVANCIRAERSERGAVHDPRRNGKGE